MTKTIAGIVFNGKLTKSSEEFILKHTGLKCILRIEEEKIIDKNMILKYKELVQIDL